MLPGRLRYLQTLSYLSILSFLPSDQPCHSLMMHHEFCRLSRIVRGSRNDCLKTAVDEIQWIEAAGTQKQSIPWISQVSEAGLEFPDAGDECVKVRRGAVDEAGGHVAVVFGHSVE